MPQDQPKIAMVNNTLSKGGAERVQARLSFFFEANGIEVHHILVKNEINYPYAGTLFNMGLLKNKTNGPLNKLKRLSALKDYLITHNFNFIIDFRTKNNFVQEYAIANWIYKTPYVMTIRHFDTNYYFPKNKSFASIIFKKAYGMVTVSKALENKIRARFGYENVSTIYNPLDFEDISRLASEALPLDYNFILGVGRMQDNIKQFDHMIRAYGKSSIREHKMKLVLLGRGEYKKVLMQLVINLDLQDDVVFLDFASNPFPYYKGAYFTALTSRGEGFPNVLLESLASGTPVVSYDCESGPSEMIEDEINGLLVQDQNESEMVIAMNRMMLDKELYQKCKENALKSVAKFEINAIGTQWLDFLNLNQTNK